MQRIKRGNSRTHLRDISETKTDRGAGDVTEENGFHEATIREEIAGIKQPHFTDSGKIVVKIFRIYSVWKC